jgi:hypothetical protein
LNFGLQKILGTDICEKPRKKKSQGGRMRQPPNYGATAASSVARQKVGTVSILSDDPSTACC